MKKTITLMLAAAAMMLSFASCQKDEVPATSEDEIMVVCEFDGNLKTTLNADGKTPEWAVGDKIKILCPAVQVVKTLTATMIKDGKIYFTVPTTVAYAGDIYAVYPSDATTMTACADGKISITIPETQDGTFASANICVAKGVRDEDNYVKLVFSNVTSVLEFSQTAATTGVKSVYVRAENAIAGTLAVSFDAKGKAVVTPDEGLTGKKVTVSGTKALDKYYVAVAPVSTGRVKFIYGKTALLESNVKMKSTTLKMNNVYACPTMDGREYKIQTGTIDGHNYVQICDLMWATNNVAITASGEQVWRGTKKTDVDPALVPIFGGPVINGDYFQWGAHENYALDYAGGDTDKGLLIYKSFTCTYCGDKTANSITLKSPEEGKMYRFSTGNSGAYLGISPYYEGSAYTKYTSARETLEASDDVASICWGSNWRTPTNAEFVALSNATRITRNNTNRGVFVTDKGETLASDFSNAVLFFPYTGLMSGQAISNTSCVVSRYWQSDTYNNNGSAYAYGTTSDAVNYSVASARYLGATIRPVSDSIL